MTEYRDLFPKFSIQRLLLKHPELERLDGKSITKEDAYRFLDEAAWDRTEEDGDVGYYLDSPC